MNDSPLVSVIIPVWNGAEFLPDAIASILAQSYRPLEILVADDGSTDNTPEVAAQYGPQIRYFAFSHAGLAETRNRGLERAQGDLIAFLDVDDLWSETKLQQQVRLLQDNPHILLVNGYTQLLRVVETHPLRRFEPWGAPTLAFSFGSALLRRELVQQVGPVDARHHMSEDVDWFLRVRERGIPMLVHLDVVQYYRRHEKNMTNDQELSKRNLLFSLKDSLKRRSQHDTQGVSLAPLTLEDKESKEQI